MKEEVILDKNGHPVKVTRIPARGKAAKLFKKSTQADNAKSPFERFAASNGTGSKCTSY